MADTKDWGVWIDREVRWLCEQNGHVVVYDNMPEARAVALNMRAGHQARNIRTGEFAKPFADDVSDKEREIALGYAAAERQKARHQ